MFEGQSNESLDMTDNLSAFNSSESLFDDCIDLAPEQKYIVHRKRSSIKSFFVTSSDKAIHYVSGSSPKLYITPESLKVLNIVQSKPAYDLGRLVTLSGEIFNLRQSIVPIQSYKSTAKLIRPSFMFNVSNMNLMDSIFSELPPEMQLLDIDSPAYSELGDIAKNLSPLSVALQSPSVPFFMALNKIKPPPIIRKISSANLLSSIILAIPDLKESTNINTVISKETRAVGLTVKASRPRSKSVQVRLTTPLWDIDQIISFENGLGEKVPKNSELPPQNITRPSVQKLSESPKSHSTEFVPKIEYRVDFPSTNAVRKVPLRTESANRKGIIKPPVITKAYSSTNLNSRPNLKPHQKDKSDMQLNLELSNSYSKV